MFKERAGSGGTRTPYQFLYIEFVVGVSGFRRNQRGKIPEIIPVASTGFWGNMGSNDPPHLGGRGFLRSITCVSTWNVIRTPKRLEPRVL